MDQEVVEPVVTDLQLLVKDLVEVVLLNHYHL
jgi:hypothetical protein